MRKLVFLVISVFFLCLSCSPRTVRLEPQTESTESEALSSKRVVLPNGLVVVAVERHKLPIFQANLVIRAGAAHEGDDKAGLANLTANLLNKGAGERTTAEIADEIDYTGGNLDASCGRVTTNISIHVLTDHVPLTMEILKDMVISPNFPDSELMKEKTRALSDIMRGKEDPFQVVSDAFQDLVYAGSTLRRPIEGYEKTVPEIERDDILGFHRDHYVPNNSVFVIVADYTIEEMLEIAKRYLGGWERREIDLPLIPSPEPVSQKRVRLVDMDINQSYVAFGHLGLKRSDPNYNAIRVMNYILGGGGFVSRIMKSIRARQGLAYSAYSYFVPGPQYRGYFRAGLQTKTGSTSQALRSLLDEIRRIRSELVDTQELEDAKSFYHGSLPRRQESYRQIAGLFIDKEIYGLEDEYWRKDLEEISSLSREDIQRVAVEYLKPENYVIAIATKVDSLKLEIGGIEEEMIERTVP